MSAETERLSSIRRSDAAVTMPHAARRPWRTARVLGAISMLCVFLIHRVQARVVQTVASGEPQTITLQAGVLDTFLDSYNPGKVQGVDTPTA